MMGFRNEGLRPVRSTMSTRILATDFADYAEKTMTERSFPVASLRVRMTCLFSLVPGDWCLIR
jgi:hypothetical protein